MRRVLEPELLDYLPPTDPRAIRSRADLRRLNGLMGHARIFTRIFYSTWRGQDGVSPPWKLVELGAGDGTLLLQLARRWSRRGVRAEATVIDRQQLVSEETCQSFSALEWTITCVAGDALEGLKEIAAPIHLLMANLFLHHFPDEVLRQLFEMAAARAETFIACEPRRGLWALAASRLAPLAGCNSVTVHDASASVRAGFSGNELSRLWPQHHGWNLREQPAGWFSHCFVAKRYE